MDASKIINIGAVVLKFLIAIVGVILAVMVAGRWDEKAGNRSDITPLLSGVVYMVIVVIIAAAAIAILFGLYKFVINAKNNIPMLIGILVFIGLLMVAFFGLTSWELGDYLISRGDKFTAEDADHGLTSGLLKMSEGGVWAVIILIPLAILAAVVAEVTKIFK